MSLGCSGAGGGRCVLLRAGRWKHTLEGVTHRDKNIQISGFYLEGRDGIGEAALKFSCLWAFGGVR